MSNAHKQYPVVVNSYYYCQPQNLLEMLKIVKKLCLMQICNSYMRLPGWSFFTVKDMVLCIPKKMHRHSCTCTAYTYLTKVGFYFGNCQQQYAYYTT